MTTFPASSYLSNASRTEAEMKTALEDFLATTKQLPGGIAQTTLTLASDQITPTRAFHVVDTQAAASTDNLAQILQTNLPDGSLLMLGIASNSRVVVVKHAAGGTGQISLVNGVDLTLDTTTMFLLLQRNGTVWEERDRFYGLSSAAHRAFYAIPSFGQNTFTGRQEWKKGANLASASTLSLGTDGNYFHVTGTTPIAVLSSTPAGTLIALEFEGSLTITHDPIALILNGQSSYTTQVGDVLMFVSEGAGTYREVPTGVRGGGAFDPTLISFFDDFDAIGNISGGYFATQHGVWLATNATPALAYTAPHTTEFVSGSGDFVGYIYRVTAVGVNTPLRYVAAAQNPQFSLKYRHGVPNSGIVVVGAMDSEGAFASGLPSNGIYAKQGTTGNMRAACRSSGTESPTIDLGVQASASVSREVRFVVTGTTSVAVYLDNVLKGTITTQIPSANLWLGVGADPLSLSGFFSLDYVSLRSKRG